MRILEKRTKKLGTQYPRVICQFCKQTAEQCKQPKHFAKKKRKKKLRQNLLLHAADFSVRMTFGLLQEVPSSKSYGRYNLVFLILRPKMSTFQKVDT